ncbi:MAG: serine/threonine-protein kinase, partial [Candidatus Thermoplasmatota archaeon]|nr:serine/threonine-protein kinase [Candidatus Thermoplasmatota archaeon]
VKDEEAYLDQRRLEVYRAALEDAIGGGDGLGPGEQARLARLRGALGLSDRDHRLLVHALDGPASGPVLPVMEPGRTVLSRYRIEGLLGEGGQGVTYRALDTTLGREVVLKTLHGPDPRKLLKEAQALAAIQHPNVVSIHDVERVGDHVYLVMEHVAGGTLRERLDAGPLGDGGFRSVAEDLLAGLEAIHEAGLVHRDIKPSNVLLTLDGDAKVADLGLATATEPTEQTTMGASGDTPGTVAYMSPEQARGDQVTRASDLFSAAATLYEASTGRRLFEPFPGESPVELRARVASWRGLDEEGGHDRMASWLAQALAPDPQDRPRTAGQMRGALAATTSRRERP